MVEIEVYHYIIVVFLNSGLDSKIICQSYCYCYIGCFDNGCTNVSLTCEINATCVIGCSNSQRSNLCPNGYAKRDYPMLDYLYHVTLSYLNKNDCYKLIDRISNDIHNESELCDNNYNEKCYFDDFI